MADFAYADPPYIGCADRHYRDHPDYSGEVDHGKLIDRLAAYHGWALSLSAESLQGILAMCPAGVLVLGWFKPISPPLGDHRVYTWEPVIMKPVRRYGPGYVPTGLIASPPQFTFRPKPEGHVIGEKPEQFAHWVFANAGLDRSEDSLHDLFPGSGAIGRAWQTYQRGRTVSNGYRRPPDPAQEVMFV